MHMQASHRQAAALGGLQRGKPVCRPATVFLPSRSRFLVAAAAAASGQQPQHSSQQDGAVQRGDSAVARSAGVVFFVASESTAEGFMLPMEPQQVRCVLLCVGRWRV
jgi:hypothetical protein